MAQKISPKRAAAILKERDWPVAERTIRRWCESGELPNARKIGGVWTIPDTDIDRIIQPALN